MTDGTTQAAGDTTAGAQREAPRLGVDLGHDWTRIVLPAESGGGEPSVLAFPTVVGESHEEVAPIRLSCAGNRAAARRDHLKLLEPLPVGVEDRASGAEGADLMRKYARYVREICGEERIRGAWCVTNCSMTASEAESKLRRIFMGELFERVAYVDETFLIAVGLECLDVSSHCVVVDVGDSAVRAAVIHGKQPALEDRSEARIAGASVTRALQAAMLRRYPELVLTERTVKALKETCGFIAPARRRAVVNIHYRGAAKDVDITDLMQEACTQILQPLVRAVRTVLATCPSDEVEAFQKNILLAGGGSFMPGLAQRLESELQADGFEVAKVTRPPNATELAARGAAVWARVLPEREWGISLFAVGT